MEKGLRGLYGRVWKFLCREKMPIWLSLILAVITGVVAYSGTYFLVPQVNYQLRIQEIRTQYIIENVRAINEDTRTLLSTTRQLAKTILDGSRIDEKNKQDILDDITQLQWRIIDLDLIFSDNADKHTIIMYRSSLTELRRSVEKTNKRDDLDDLFKKLENVAVSSYNLLSALYKLAGFDISISPISER